MALHIYQTNLNKSKQKQHIRISSTGKPFSAGKDGAHDIGKLVDINKISIKIESLDETYEFKYFAKWILDNFNKTKKELFLRIKKDFPKLNIRGIELGGSYGKGNPNEDSDIDLKVIYDADIDESEVAEKLAGIYNVDKRGEAGVYDIEPVKLQNYKVK